MRPAALSCWLLVAAACAALGGAVAGEGSFDDELRQLRTRDPRLYHWLFPVDVINGPHTKPTPLSPKAKVHILFCEGLSHQQRGKHEDAIAKFEEALALVDPESPSILFEIGYSYYRLGKNEKAVDYLTRSLKLDPDNGPAHETLAFVHAAATRRAEALKELEAAAKAKRRPQNHESLVRRIAWIYERQDDRKKAIEWYQFMLECGYRGRETYRKLGILQLKERRYGDALGSFRQVARRTPSDRASAADIARAFADLTDKDRNAAIRHIEDAVAKADDPASREVLAMAYKAAGRRDDMLRQLERVAAAGSRRAETQRKYLAEYYEQIGELTKAIEWRREILKHSPTGSDHVRLAGLFVKRQQMPEAAAAYRKAIEAEPKRRDLLRRVAGCHSALYHWDKAAAVLQEYLDGEKPLDPTHATIAFELGDLYHHAGKAALAATWKQRAFKLLADAIGKPRLGRRLDDAQLHLLTAELYYADHKPQKALDYLIVARRLDPKDPRKALLVAAASKRVQKWNDAARAYQEFLVRDNRSLAAAGAYLELATCQEITGDNAAAIVSREKAKQLILRAGRAAQRDEAKAAVQAQLGETALKRNQPKLAIRHFLDAVRLDPAEGLYHLYLGQAYQYLGDWRRVAASCKTYLESLDRKPDAAHARTLFRLGVAQTRSGQPDLGRKNKDRAIQLITAELETLEKEKRGTPAGKADLLRDLGGLLSGDKQHEKTITTIRSAIALAPRALRTDYRLALAAVYDDIKRYDDSEKVLLQTLKDDPDDPGILNHLGYHYAVRGIKLDEAVTLVRRALHQEPLNGAYIDTLGWAYYKQGKYQQALEQLLRATRYEEDAVIRDHVGDACHKLGQIDKAREAWTKALALDPDIEGVAQKLKTVKPKPAPKPQKQPAKPPKPQKPPEKKPEPKKPPDDDDW